MYGWGNFSLIYFKTIQIYYLDYYKVAFVNILHVEGFQEKIKKYLRIHLHIKIVIK
jgi:hypothetical protein